MAGGAGGSGKRTRKKHIVRQWKRERPGKRDREGNQKTSCTKTEHWFAGIAARNSFSAPASRNSTQETISKMTRSVARNAVRHARTQHAVSSSARCSTQFAQHAASRPRCRSSRETTSRSIAPSALHSAAADNSFKIKRERGRERTPFLFFSLLPATVCAVLPSL